MPEKQIVINIQPIGSRVEIDSGETLLDATRAAGVGLISLCGGDGWCGSCLVRIVEGEVNPPTEVESENLGDEKINQGFRLACQVVPITDAKIDVPSDSLSAPQRLQIEGTRFDLELAPAVVGVNLDLTPPNLDDLRDDTKRIIDALSTRCYEGLGFSYPVLQTISDVLRERAWSIRTVIREGEVIGLLPYESNLFGVAVDIGTTKIAIYLVDLQTGVIVGKAGAMNPQIAFGEDIISRIAYCRTQKKGRRELQRVVIDTLNDHFQEMCTEAEIETTQIVDMVIVGNTAMHHLLTNLPVDQLVFAPYVPAVTGAIDIRARDLGIKIATGGYVHLLPNISGYVGADHSAVILSTELWQTAKTVLVIDVGTNTEISLIHKGLITSCSCASGPAFEGAHIRHGMRAAPGAIEHMQFFEGEIRLTTIQDQLPIGICGSGILDIVSELRAAGFMDDKGAFIDDCQYVRKGKEDRPEFQLVPGKNTANQRDITISRKDVNEIQLAKAAIRAGQEILLAEVDIKQEDVDSVIIAGAFGTYLNVSNAKAIGMFINIPDDRFSQVGNAAGMGAIQALLSMNHRASIKEVVKGIKYIELTTNKDFQDIFLKAMYFD